MLCFSSSNPWLKRSPWSGMCLCLINIYFIIWNSSWAQPSPKVLPWVPGWVWHPYMLLPSSHRYNALLSWAPQVAQMVKNTPAMQETRVWSLGWEDPLEKGMATHSSILAWRIPWTEETGGLHSPWWHRVRHNWVTNTFYHHTVLKLSITFLTRPPQCEMCVICSTQPSTCTE